MKDKEMDVRKKAYQEWDKEHKDLIIGNTNRKKYYEQVVGKYVDIALHEKNKMMLKELELFRFVPLEEHKEALKKRIRSIEKIAIELAYQKKENKLVRKDINHLELFKKFRKELEEEDDKEEI